MSLNLSTLAIVLGLGFGLPQIYGLLKPQAFAAAVRKFPRSVPIGCLLTLIATAWFVVNVYNEPIADFAAYKDKLMIFFAAVGILTCFFVQDFLAVRGLAVFLLLLAKLMVDTGRSHLGESPWVILFQIWAYLFVIAGIWFTVSPWRLRDLLGWATATEQRIKVGCGVRLALGLMFAVLGFTKY